MSRSPHFGSSCCRQSWVPEMKSWINLHWNPICLVQIHICLQVFHISPTCSTSFSMVSTWFPRCCTHLIYISHFSQLNVQKLFLEHIILHLSRYTNISKYSMSFFTKWGFPEIGLSLNHHPLHGIFHHKNHPAMEIPMAQTHAQWPRGANRGPWSLGPGPRS